MASTSGTASGAPPARQAQQPVRSHPLPETEEREATVTQQGSPAPQAPVTQQSSPAPQASVTQQGSPAPQASVTQQGSPAPQASVTQQGSPAPQASVTQQSSPAPQTSTNPSAAACNPGTSAFAAILAQVPPPAPIPASAITVADAQVAPTLLIRRTEEGQFEVCPTAIGWLRSLGHKPVAVISIAGVLRGGKSYILNRLIGTAGGFEVFLDSEGTASHEQTNDSEATLVALAGLVSSLLIFNQNNCFDENAVNSLFQVALIMRDLFFKTTSGQQTTALPPKLLVLLRNWNLILQGTLMQHIEASLAEKEPDSRRNATETMNRNKVTARIKEVFQERVCHALPTPLLDDENGAVRANQEPFDQGVRALASLVYSSATPKELNSRLMTGPIMAQLLQAAVVAANNGDLPHVGSIWQSAIDAELRAATAAATAAYKQSVGDLGQYYTVSTATAAHEVALEEAHVAFELSVNLAGAPTKASSWADLTEQLDQKLKIVLEHIKLQQAEACLEFRKLLQVAKADALAAFDQDAYLQKCVNTTVDAQPAFEEHEDAAWQAFDALRNMIPETEFLSQDEQRAANAVVEDELRTALQAILVLALEKIKLNMAESEKQRITQEKEEIERQIEVDREARAAANKATVQYKAEMKLFLHSCKDLEALRAKHEELTSSLTSSLPSTLPEDCLSKLTTELAKQCNELHATDKEFLQQRKLDEDKAIVYQAADNALQQFLRAVKTVPQNCTHEAWASTFAHMERLHDLFGLVGSCAARRLSVGGGAAVVVVVV
eukprot:gene1183-1520_t